jgi:hypothetical protein
MEKSSKSSEVVVDNIKTLPIDRIQTEVKKNDCGLSNEAKKMIILVSKESHREVGDALELLINLGFSTYKQQIKILNSKFTANKTFEQFNESMKVMEKFLGEN